VGLHALAPSQPAVVQALLSVSVHGVLSGLFVDTHMPVLRSHMEVVHSVSVHGSWHNNPPPRAIGGSSAVIAAPISSSRSLGLRALRIMSLTSLPRGGE
jgi:hypothetical protein